MLQISRFISFILKDSANLKFAFLDLLMTKKLVLKYFPKSSKKQHFKYNALNLELITTLIKKTKKFHSTSLVFKKTIYLF